VAGQRVLVVGAGPIGLLAAQCARAEGAVSVVISDTRADRLTLAAALGFPPLDGISGPALEEWGDARPLRAVPELDLIDVAILCAGGPVAIASAFAAVRPGGTVVALGLSGAATIPFDFDGLVVRDVDLIGVLGSVGFWPDAIELITSGRVQTEPLVTGSYGIERTRDALEQLVKPGTLKVLIEPHA
jgi:L-iditol 2-dehydrogenase